MAEFSEHSGLAKQIRSQDESVNEYDLAGMNEAQASSLVKDAFGSPIEGKEPIKVTFIIGAGKLARQRYDDNLSKYLSAALRELGYEEDRAASLCVECMGTFKSQHDTSKNVKTMHVFPRVALSGGDEDAAGAEGDAASAAVHSIELLCASCELPTFKEMVYSEHHNTSCNSIARMYSIRHIKQPLTPQEQVLYDASSAELLSQKTQWLTASLKQLVDDGALTAAERTQVLAQLDSKLTALSAELAAVTPADGEPPASTAAAAKADKLSKQKAALVTRRAAVAAVRPTSHPLKRAAEMKE
eukprot:21168-Heterococcus_DN1.PRE.2